MEIFFIVLSVFLVVILLWFVIMLNSLRRLEIRVEESLAEIDVVLTKRYDVLTKMLETARGYARYEADTLLNVVRERDGSISKMPLARKIEVVEEMDRVQEGINVIVEQYPDLKADKTFNNLQKAIVNVEEHLHEARRLYNSNVKVLNEKITVFPSSIIANIANITKRDFFQADKDKIENNKFGF
ncbi:MAG TPA: LemA family protein [Bacilli bacterium]|nr:LemA family protein [Bacilli bacterium]HQA19928.1 LemA family protein [Bacilli bacterium]HQD92487.1 LemA family protein [Bacilli bacterium]